MNKTLWTTSLGLPLLLAFLVLWTAAIPTYCGQRLRRENVLSEPRARKEQPSTTASPTNNFGIKFVPLFSLIATYIPKLLGRFGNFTRTTSNRNEARKARGIDTAQINGFYCYAENLGTWKDPADCRQFYKCKKTEYVSENVHGNIRQDNEMIHQSARLEMLSRGSISIEYHRCISDYVYSESTKKCESESETTRCVEKQR